MELSYTQSRSTQSSFSQLSYDNVMKQKVGLYIPDDDKPSEEARIIFKTRNLTKTLIENNMMMLNFKPSKGKEVAVDEVGPTSPNLIKLCLLSSIHNHVPIISGSNQSRGRLPLTTCTKHGKVGFLPLEYVRELPEYTCTTYKYPTNKVVHSFDDCILEFPRTEVAGSSSTKHVKDDEYMKKCYNCCKKLSKPIDIFMYRDTPYCCIECRYDAFVSYCWNKKQMKDNDSESSLSLDEDFMFCMGSSTSVSVDEDAMFCIGSS
ncbi:uncharacterized protein LOC105157612 [Sesamum indicum]|uniref:Uncharacterized protein LOC105157612 n=1 Tax=Sesamum indicum TaxID=4182 RepID=A0A6I9SXH4_SESIN|nr:uncharacterized protein LOC105157612 [Sesamum indicum]